MKKILVACEESQAVTVEFRLLGCEAYSCDLIETSGKHPEWHIKHDVTALLDGDCTFLTEDGESHIVIGKWDAIIAFPPCTYLTVSGNRWFNVERYGEKALKRLEERKKAISFFMEIVHAGCDRLAVENPVGVMSTNYRKPDQIINPYEFGDPYEKRTCLWLKGLPELTPTNVVVPEKRVTLKSGKTLPKWYCEAAKYKGDKRSIVRSKTFPGIAKAMAEQWYSVMK